MRRRLLAICASLFIGAFGPSAVLANTSTLDQSSTGSDAYISGNYLWAQTFTAGRYGTLDYVDILLTATSSTVTVSLQGTTGNPPVPDGVIHASKTRGFTTSGLQWEEFDFFNNYVVLPGHTYALFIFPGDRASLYGSVASDYSGGQALVFHGGTWSPDASYFVGSPADFGFKTFLGAAPATPTPTPTPTRAPTATRTPAPAPTSTPTPAAASAAAASASDASLLAAASPVSSPSSTDAPAGVAADSSATPGSGDAIAGASAGTPATPAPAAPAGGPGSGGSGGADLSMPIVAMIVALAALSGGFLFLLLRRRRRPAAEG